MFQKKSQVHIQFVKLPLPKTMFIATQSDRKPMFESHILQEVKGKKLPWQYTQHFLKLLMT